MDDEEEEAFGGGSEAERPDEELVNRPFAVLPDGSAEFNYDLWRLKLTSGATIQCIVVSQVADGRYLVAFPHQVWHRTVSKRTLPAILNKPLLVEVVCASVEDMTQELAFYMKVWVGYITAESFKEMEIQRDGMEMINYPFLFEDSDGYLPFSPALVEALEERFSFLSADSGRGGVGDGSAVAKGASGSLDKRVSHLEDLLGKMSSSLETVLERVSQPASKEAKPRVQFAEKPKVIPGRSMEMSSKFPSLDPSVVASALSAGVPEENLREMERLMGQSQKGKKLREPALRKPAKKVTVLNALSESEEEAEEAESGSPSGHEQEPATMEGALSKLTELVTLLSADKVKRARSSKMDLALENLGGGSSAADSSSGSTGKRAAAARRALRLALQESPEEISGVIEKMMLEDLTLQTMMPGMPKKDFSARAWVEHRSRIGAYKSSAYLAWSASGILDDLANGRVAHARARACLMLAMIDQVSIDRGNWALGAELMLEQGPPLSVLASHTLPSVADGESPFSRIVDARWAEVMLTHLKDAEDYLQKRKSLGRRTAEDGEKEPNRPKAKPKAKGKNQGDAAETA